MAKKKRLLIKISGGAIKNDTENDIYDTQKITAVCKQLAELNKTCNIGIVVGGGNIWRGNMTKNGIFRRLNADYMGMMSTVMNGLAFKEVLHKLGVEAAVFSALHIEKATFDISLGLLEDAFKENKILIFVGGTGHPYFTTDTACAMRAIDMDADIVLMGKDGVDGIFSDDPKKNPKAKFYDDITFDEAINKNLKVMDMSAFTLLKEANIEVRVFNLIAKNGIINAYNKKCKFTRVHK